MATDIANLSYLSHPWKFFTEEKKKSSVAKKYEKVDVCIFAEGTYPFIKGGVSSVIHQIIEWVKTIYLADEQKKKNKFWDRIIQTAPNLNRKEAAQKIVSVIKAFSEKDYKKFNSFYFEFLNPLTRTVNIQHTMDDFNFINELMECFKEHNITLNDLYWIQKEFASLALAIFDQVYPVADIYHSHSSGYAGFAASIAALQHNKKFYLTEHSLYIRDVLNQLNEMYNYEIEKHFDKNMGKDLSAQDNIALNSIKMKKNLWDQWFYSLGHLTYKKSEVTTYLYDRIAREATYYGSDIAKSRIIPNGINYDRFSETREQQALRHAKRTEKDFVWKIALVGRIVPVKGILDLIEAVALLKQQGKIKFKVDLIGPKDEDLNYYEQCVSLVKKLDLEDVITFAGSQNVIQALKNVDLVLLSSHSEALPMVILEAMSSSIPVISTDVGSVRQIMMDKANCRTDSTTCKND